MIDINKLESTNSKYLDNIKRIIFSNKDIVKRYKMEQAEMMKQIMLSDDSSVNIENFFKNFQVELKQRENEEKNKVKELVSREIEMMRSEMLSLLDTFDITSAVNSPVSNMSSMPQPTANYNPVATSTMASAPQSSYQNTGQNQPVDNFQNDMNNQVNMSDVESILKDIDGGQSIQASSAPQQPTFNSNVLDQELTNSISNMSPDTEVPVETKELDEWISEIKNLI